jgi:Rrf2 family iron-sulfur cluster assembly transcriptional regulator
MFSKTTEYALRATIYIAQKSTKAKKLALAEIANAIDSPLPFTAKTLQLLTRKNKIISSTPGPNGGFYITEPAKQLPVRAVLEAIGEDAIITKCILGLRKCRENKPCPMHTYYKAIRIQLIQLFETKTIQNLVEELSKGNLFINNTKTGIPK